MYKRIDHIALHVGDLDQSVAFYEGHFGFKNYFEQAVTGGPRIVYLKLGDTVLELTHRSEGSMTGFHFCLETDGFDAAVSQLQANGVELIRAPHQTAAREPREKGLAARGISWTRWRANRAARVTSICVRQCCAKEYYESQLSLRRLADGVCP